MGSKRTRVLIHSSSSEDNAGCSTKVSEIALKDSDHVNLISSDLSGPDDSSDLNLSISDDSDVAAYKLLCERKKVKKLKVMLAKSLKTREDLAKFSKDAFTRFSVKTFGAVIESLDDHQKSVICKYCFGFLLEFQRCFVPNRFAKWLARHVDLESDQIVVNGKSVALTPESVHLIIGLPIGGKCFPHDSSCAKSKILSMVGKPQVNFFANKLIRKDNMSDEDIFTCFMIVALNSFLCPNSSLAPSSSYLGVFENVDKAKEFDWSKFVVDWLLVKIKEFIRGKAKSNKRSHSKTLGGCLYYLAVVYLDRLDFGDRQVRGGIPRIGVWKGDMIKLYSQLDSVGSGQYGSRLMLDAPHTSFAKHVTPAHSHGKPVPQDFKLKLDALCGSRLDEDSTNKIWNLVSKFTSTATIFANIDNSSIGNLPTDLKTEVSELLNYASSVNNEVEQLVLSVIKICLQNGMGCNKAQPSHSAIEDYEDVKTKSVGGGGKGTL
ncbi:hypothetical protein BS78_05G189400 [Paspalum vaginatum]|nr:hypothetical protein BS78_05G189400 [Paspalum vaginatum]